MSVTKNPTLETEYQSLKVAFDDARKIQTQHPDLYLNGVMGLTGICMGYALDVAQKVEQWLRDKQQTKLELPDRPSARIQHLEKLLILAVFETIGQQDDWREIRRDWDMPLVEKIYSKYQELVKKMAGVNVEERLPKEGFVRLDKVDSFFQSFPTSEDKDHYLIILSNPDESIYNGHMVYFHPKIRLISDGAACLSWRSSQGAEAVFPQVIAQHFKEKYSSFREFFIYKVRFSQIPTDSLMYQRVTSRVSTLYSMAAYSPILATRFALSYVTPRFISKYMTTIPISPGAEFYKALEERIKANDLNGFLKRVDNRAHRIHRAL